MSALEAFQPSLGNPWDRTLAAHLLNRAGFGGLPEDIERISKWGLDRAVDYLVDFEKAEDEPTFEEPTPPHVPVEEMAKIRQLPEQERQIKLRELRRANVDSIDDIRGWWIRRMLRTKRPLQEKMTLFWHGHFATSATDVKRAVLMLRENEFLRANCVGNFRDLLLGISRDPAMLEYLDNKTNRKQHPNENYARELMELFSMGIGNYTEEDVKAAARAFTGWTFRDDRFVFASREHDYGTKKFLGVTGDLDGTDVIDAILKQPCTARFMATKLLKFFVSDNPELPVVEELATLIRDKNYEFRPVLRTLFRSQVFYSPQAYRGQIKSPAQLVVSSVRLLGVTLNENALAIAMRMIGQDLLYPPNVKGWDGGETWINTTTLLLRYNLAGYLLTGNIPGEGTGSGTAKGPDRRRFRLDRYGRPHNDLDVLFGPDVAADAARLVDGLTARLLQAKLDATARQWLIDQAQTTRTSERPKHIAHLIMSMPDYQLC